MTSTLEQLQESAQKFLNLHGQDVVLTALFPNWKCDYSYDPGMCWEMYVPSQLIEIWDSLSDEARVAACLTASLSVFRGR